MDNLALDLPETEEDGAALPPPPPQENPLLLGHDVAEKALLKDIAAGRLPHALIFSGPGGIGKATLAFRLARYLLSGKAEEDSGGLFGEDAPAESLAADMEHPAARKIAAGSHPGLLYVAPSDTDGKGKKRANAFIGIDGARRVPQFLQQTAADGGWRVVIIDNAEEMNIAAQNAVLKTLEEPPPQCLIVIVTSAPGKLLPTVHSRCRLIPLEPLSETHISELFDKALPGLKAEEKRDLAAAARGRIGYALTLHEAGGTEIYREITELLSGFTESRAHEIAAALSTDKQRFALFGEILCDLLAETAKDTLKNRAAGGFAQSRSPQDWFTLWEAARDLLRRADAANLDIYAAVLQLLDLLRR